MSYNTLQYYLNSSDACLNNQKYGIRLIRIKYTVTVTLSETFEQVDTITRVNNVKSINSIIFNGQFAR